MIRSYRNSGLEAFATTGSTRRMPVQQTRRVQLLLAALDAATKPTDMAQPGFHFHNLAPGQPSRFSVRVTGNYRLTFAWDGQDAIEVDLEDYH